MVAGSALELTGTMVVGSTPLASPSFCYSTDTFSADTVIQTPSQVWMGFHDEYMGGEYMGGTSDA